MDNPSKPVDDENSGAGATGSEAEDASDVIELTEDNFFRPVRIGTVLVLTNYLLAPPEWPKHHDEPPLHQLKKSPQTIKKLCGSSFSAKGTYLSQTKKAIART